MMIFHPIRAGLIVASSMVFAQAADPTSYATVWMLGDDDNSRTPFSSPTWSSNLAPGSAVEKDDDYYFAGDYAAPVGTLTGDEAVENFEREIAQGDTHNRIHFPLAAAERSAESMLRVTIDLINGGAWTGVSEPGFQTHDVVLRLNGVEIGSWDGIHYARALTVEISATAVSARAQDNVLEIERTGGATDGYIQFDYLRLEADADALADGDSDGMPRWFEEQYGMNDAASADAASDTDFDGLNALAEFVLGTNPTNPDSDGDGLGDAEESATDPLDADSDDDGLADGAETETLATNPDSDNDLFPDGYEVAVGTDPGDSGSVPFAFAGSIGVQFVCETEFSKPLGVWESAGLVPTPHWNASDQLPSWNGYDAAITGSMSDLVNGAGTTTTAAATWSYDEAEEGYHGLGANEALLNGMIRTNNYPDGNLPVSLDVTGIPYASYDLILYVGHRQPNRRAYTQLGTDSGTQRYFLTDSAPPFVAWTEATAASVGDIVHANYVRYRGLSGANQSITVHQIDADEVALHGFQVIETGSDSDGDGLVDAVELEHHLNPAVSDIALDSDGDSVDNVAEIMAGTDPFNTDTDGDRLDDGAELLAGTNPLNPDTDGDGLMDGSEVYGLPYATSPLLADSDGDGRDDPTELRDNTDPTSADSAVAPMPVWNVSTRTWTWQVDDVQLLWDQNQSPLSGGAFRVFTADIEIEGVSSSLASLSLYYQDGVLSSQFRVLAGAFYENGEPGNNFYNTTSADLKAGFGFSGYGEKDDSYPLRFVFSAHQPDSEENQWNLDLSIYQTLDMNSPVLVTSRSWTGATAADPRLLDGTAPWSDGDGNTAAPKFSSAPGVSYHFTRTPLGPPDADNDGMPDAWENTYGFDTTDASDASLDADLDGLTNREEYFSQTHPRVGDSDDDGVSDGEEVRQGSSPTSGTSRPAWYYFSGNPDDLNGDGVSDAWVMWSGGGVRMPGGDDDGDGMTNLEESVAGTDPNDAQSRLDMRVTRSGDSLWLDWSDLPSKRHSIHSSATLDSWQPMDASSPTFSGGRRWLEITSPFTAERQFFQAQVEPVDSDGDGVEDWIEENVLFTSVSDPDSLGIPSERDGLPPLSGDAKALVEHLSTGSYPGSAESAAPSPKQAARFLMQATFGPTQESIEHLREIGYQAWLEEQMAAPASRLTPYIRQIKEDFKNDQLDPYPNYGDLVRGENFTTPWARAAIGGEDQLRQRVAFALSQILVVSRRDAMLQHKIEGMAHYYDMLSEQAFGNYGDLLLDVAMHPVMGVYLSHVGNQKADPTIPRFPDENFAREVMQLFSIGLWELNPDGTRKLDSGGEPIETYGNAEITEMARVFTGLYFDSPYGWGSGGWSDSHYLKPLVMHPDRHDFGTKRLLNGVVIPAREASVENGLADIRDAVDLLFRHPNTAPIISRKLIQFLVTANPSRAYLARVSAVFEADASGERGNLGAVVKAILLDPEARESSMNPNFGKVREPVIRTMHLGRLLRMTEANPEFVWWNGESNYFGKTYQEPTYSPSVFNFYTPEYQAPGSIRNSGLVSPAFQIVDSYSAISFPNLLWDYLTDGFAAAWKWEFRGDFSDWLPLADDHQALVDRANLLLCAGSMTHANRNSILTALDTPGLGAMDKVNLVLWVSINSPAGVAQQ